MKLFSFVSVFRCDKRYKKRNSVSAISKVKFRFVKGIPFAGKLGFRDNWRRIIATLGELIAPFGMTNQSPQPAHTPLRRVCEQSKSINTQACSYIWKFRIHIRKDASCHSVHTLGSCEVKGRHRPGGSKQWAYYQIHKILSCACAGNAGNVFPVTELKENR